MVLSCLVTENHINNLVYFDQQEQVTFSPS